MLAASAGPKTCATSERKTPADVSAAIQAQNVQVASGELGGLPSVQGQQLNATIVGPTRLHSPDQFGAILLKVNADGSRVHLRDVARDLPLDRLLTETDSPFLPPQGQRGKRNEPANVAEVAQTLGSVRNLGTEEIAATTAANFRRFFRLGAS